MMAAATVQNAVAVTERTNRRLVFFFCKIFDEPLCKFPNSQSRLNAFAENVSVTTQPVTFVLCIWDVDRAIVTLTNAIWMLVA